MGMLLTQVGKQPAAVAVAAKALQERKLIDQVVLLATSGSRGTEMEANDFRIT